MPLYLDYSSTTPVKNEVFELMKRLFIEDFGNSGSRTHLHGSKAKEEVGKAREIISSIFECEPLEVVFTSGATESNNMAILGLENYGKENNKNHIITSAIEHKAVLEPIQYLEKNGFEVSYLKPNKTGRIETNQIKEALRENTFLVSIMHVNNETGIIQPIEEIANELKNSEAFFHVDAAQSFGKLNTPLLNKRIDMISISGHKIYGPKGIGALIARDRDYKRLPLKPIIHGGGQERGLRPGTLPVPLVAGLGLAAKLMSDDKNWWNDCKKIKDEALKSFSQLNININGDQEFCMPHILNISFKEYDSEALIVMIKNDLSVSNGSACTSSSYEPSHVLKAMDLDDNIIKSAIRLSWSLDSGTDFIKILNQLSSKS